MAKKGMKRPDVTHTQSKNETAPVPEIQGRAKHKNEHVNPIIAGTHAPSLKVYHTTPFKSETTDRPISKVYSSIDTDLARDNLENDVTYADMQDL